MFETKLLLNHALPTGDVTWGYQRPSMEHLRACAERIAEFLVERVGGVDGNGLAFTAGLNEVGFLACSNENGIAPINVGRPHPLHRVERPLQLRRVRSVCASSGRHSAP
jgi:hypothetical protein